MSLDMLFTKESMPFAYLLVLDEGLDPQPRMKKKIFFFSYLFLPFFFYFHFIILYWFYHTLTEEYSFKERVNKKSRMLYIKSFHKDFITCLSHVFSKIQLPKHFHDVFLHTQVRKMGIVILILQVRKECLQMIGNLQKFPKEVDG